MTFIPGTGTATPVKIDPKNAKKSISSQVISVINVHDIKNPVSKEYVEEDQIWYNQLKYWMMFGGIGSAVFAILSIINVRFLFLLPLGPYVAYLSWHMKRWVRKNAKKFDSLS